MAAAAAAAVVLAAPALAAAGPAAGGGVFWEGRPIAPDEPPRMVNGTLMVPVRLFEALGARVVWEAAARAAVLERGEARVRLQADSPVARVGERAVALAQPPVVADGRLLVPLRATAEALGLRVEWDARTGRVDIRGATAPDPPASGAAPGPAAAGASPPAPAREQDPPAAAAGSAGAAFVPSPLPAPPPLPASPDDDLAALLAVLPAPRPGSLTLPAALAGARAAPTGSGGPGQAPAVGGAPPAAPGPSAPAQAPLAPAATTPDPGASPRAEPAAAVRPTRPAPETGATTADSRPGAGAPPAPAAAPGQAGGAPPTPAPPESGEPESPPAAVPSVAEVAGVTVRREGGRTRIDVIGDGALRLSGDPVVLADPPRLVMDLQPARLGAATVDYPADGALVKGVRMAQHGPDSVRVAVDLTAPVGYDLQRDPEDGHPVLFLRHAVSAVYWVWGAGGRGQLWVEMSGMAAVRTATLSDPLRLLVDIQQATLVTSPGEWEVSQGPVRRFRVSQFQPDVVRIVLEVAEPIQPRVITSVDLTRALLDADPGKPPPAPPGDMDLVLDVYSRITGVAVRPMGPQGAAVVVQATAPIEPRTFYLRNPGRLVLDLPGAVVDPSLDRSQLEQHAGTGPAVSVRVGQFLPRSARVVVELRQPVGYQIFTADGRQTLVVALGERPLAGRTVAIDPGHGGYDPGAMGVSGTPEKVYNLDIARRLAGLLESVGVEVTMTRRGDVYVGLDDRVAAAVQAGADVFVSVHNNASTSRQAVGTEVFYSPNSPASQRLAELLYDSLLDKLDRPGRGVRMRRDLRVLRLAPMPAALVEVAFVDNPDDEGRLRDPAFRQQAAEAMFAAIVSFFSQPGNDTVRAARAPVAR